MGPAASARIAASLASCDISGGVWWLNEAGHRIRRDSASSGESGAAVVGGLKGAHPPGMRGPSGACLSLLGSGWVVARLRAASGPVPLGPLGRPGVPPPALPIGHAPPFYF